MREVRVLGDWRPRPYQVPLWRHMERGGKRAVAVWHRRAGKDDIALRWTAVAAMQKPATYWHMLPEAAQCRKAIWESVNPHTGRRRLDEAFPKEIIADKREGDMFIRFVNGATWQLVGSDNYNSLVGSPPYGMIMSEFSLADPMAWGYLSPILAENGGWALFIYTSRGRNHGASLYDDARQRPDWFAERLTAEQTGVFTKEALVAERRNYHELFGDVPGEALYQQEYFSDFEAPILGAYYGRRLRDAEQDSRIGKVPWTPALNVTTAWDLGMRDSTAIWFVQQNGFEVRVIDYYESSGVGVEHYADVLKAKPYSYGTHIFPHDVEVVELGTGKSRYATLSGLGIKGKVLPQTANVADGITAGRNLIPRCWFDAEKCRRGLEALRNYRAKWDEKNRILSPTPIHDWASHAADAWRYLAEGLKDAPSGRRRGQTMAETGNPFA